MKTKILTIALAALTIGLLGSCKKEDLKVSVTDVRLDQTELTITVGDADVKLTATVAPENATDKTVSWASNAESVATVDASGKVTAVAPGEATITVTTVDGGKTATCTVTVKAALPAGALAGEFTVDASGKKVHFSQGNLYYDGSAFKFEANQYDFRTYAGKNSCINGESSTTGTPAGHWGLFGWVGASSTQFTSSPEIYGVSTSNTNSHYGNSDSDALKADWGTAIDDNGTWSTLSSDEWTYLFNTTSRMVNSKPCYSNAADGVTIGGTTYYGVFIYPDNYSGDVVSGSMTWDQINAAGIVFLPAAGCRNGSNVNDVGDFAYYWSSTAYNSYFVYYVKLDSNVVTLGTRNYGYSVRLITDVK